MSIPGLINLNNNCFLNSLLQGLASCQKFQKYVDKIAWMIQNRPKLLVQEDNNNNNINPKEQQSQKLGLGRKVAKFVSKLLEFVVGSSAGDINSLAIALQLLLQQLQYDRSTQTYFSASDIQQHLENKSNILEWGYQNDAAEALQVLFDVLKTEAQTNYLKHMQQILCSPSSILSCSSNSNQQTQSQQEIEFDYLNFKFQGPSSSQVRTILGVLDKSGLMQGWQSVGISPFEFNVVYKMTCSVCSYRSPLEFQIQNCLFVDIPTNVIGSEQFIKIGSTLSHCLESYGSITFVEDVRCPRCQLRFLLKYLKEQFKISDLPNLKRVDDEIQIENKEIKQLEWFASSECSYMPSEKYINQILSCSSINMSDANNVTCRAIRQTQVASLPQILAIQLKRGQFNWELGVSCKLSGYIPFPINLNPQNISGLFYQQGDDEQNGEYELRAVIVHLGAHSGGGHYIVFRRVVVDDEICWFRISDCNVNQVQEQEVLSCEASLILYELST